MKRSILFLILTGFALLLNSCKKETTILSSSGAAHSGNTDTTSVSTGSLSFLLNTLSMLDTANATLKYSAISGGSYSSRMGSGDLSTSEAWYARNYAFEVFTFDENHYYVNARWEQLYDGICRANKVLHQIEHYPDSIPETYKPDLIAQARFLRGLYYFWIANDYGRGFITEATSINDEDFTGIVKTKTELEDEMIIPDLKYAYSHLSASPAKHVSHPVASIGAATALLGKVHLYREEWSVAAAYFLEIINNPDYRLVVNPLDNFSDENEYNSESIFEVEFTSGKDVHYGSTTNLQLEYSTQIGQMFGNLFMGGYNVLMPSYTLHELFLADSVDINNPNYSSSIPYSLRRHNTIVTKNDSDRYYRVPMKEIIQPGYMGDAPCFCYGQTAYLKKYTHWYKYTSEYQYSGINFRHIRLADVYLMYAEAILQDRGDAAIDEAISYIDLVRSRAGVLTLEHYRSNYGQIPELHKITLDGSPRTWTNITAQSLLTHLMRVERPLELCFEGHRWYDLRRWGIITEVLQDASDLEEWIFNTYPEPINDPVTRLGIVERVKDDAQQAFDNYIPQGHDYLPHVGLNNWE